MRKTHFLTGLVGLVLGWTFGLVQAADPKPSLDDPKGLVIDVGTDVDTNFLAFGWSRPERGKSFLFRWIKHLEADVWFEVPKVEELEVSIRAAPLYLNWQRQRIGLMVNEKFVAEWTCPDGPDFKDYTAIVPAAFFKKGRNRITFRMGYRKKHANDSRELSLAVSDILIKKGG